MAAWGLMTACLRPLAGEPLSELFERSYNYCVPLAAFLMIAWDVKRHGWFHWVKNIPTLNTEQWSRLKLLLQSSDRCLFNCVTVLFGVFGR